MKQVHGKTRIEGIQSAGEEVGPLPSLTSRPGLGVRLTAARDE